MTKLDMAFVHVHTICPQLMVKVMIAIALAVRHNNHVVMSRDNPVSKHVFYRETHFSSMKL